MQWVGERKWIYECNFPASYGPGVHAELVFEGLDTFAEVSLNDHVILKSKNMFVEHRVDVSSHLSASGTNLLSILFYPALIEARHLQLADPNHKWICWNGEPARLAVRKAQYHWGWDWGPKLMTCGPWRPIRIETYRCRIDELKIDVSLDKGRKKASIDISSTMVGNCSSGVTLELWHNGVCEATQVVTSDSKGTVEATLVIENPKLWWPHGYGAQPLYEAVAFIGPEGHRTSKKFGIRDVELVQDKDKFGRSFFFRVNGVDIFGAGANWIPADSFTPRISDSRYRQWLQLMVEGRQVVVRCWGGGIWEPDIFFDLCDELGILVWQDFLFACGSK